MTIAIGFAGHLLFSVRIYKKMKFRAIWLNAPKNHFFADFVKDYTSVHYWKPKKNTVGSDSGAKN